MGGGKSFNVFAKNKVEKFAGLPQVRELWNKHIFIGVNNTLCVKTIYFELLSKADISKLFLKERKQYLYINEYTTRELLWKGLWKKHFCKSHKHFLRGVILSWQKSTSTEPSLTNLILK